MKRQYVSLLIAILFLLITIVGCNSNSSITPSPSKSTKDTIIIGTPSVGTSVESQNSESNAAAQYLYNIYDTLVLRKPVSKKIEYIPGLAESWKQVNEVTWEFKLRKGVKFHDGSDFTAKDVDYSISRVIAQDVNQISMNVYYKFFNNFKEIKIVDDYTVQIITAQSEPLMLYFVSDPNSGINSKTYFDKVGKDQVKLVPSGTGPYKVTEFKPDDILVLERFEDYWGQKAPLKSITYKNIPEIASRITALINGEVNMITNIPPDQEIALQKRNGIKTMGTSWPMFHVLVLNMNDPVLNNQKVRQAMNLSLDRKKLSDSLWMGKAIVPTSYQFGGYYSDSMYFSDVQSIKLDNEKAKALVKESGYNGQEIVLLNRANYYSYFDLALQAAQQMWKGVGLNVKIENLEKLPSDRSKTAGYTWSNPLHYPDPMGVVDTHWAASGGPYRQKVFEPEKILPNYWDLYNTARFNSDTAKRAGAWKQLVAAYDNDIVGWLDFYQPYEYFAMDSDINWEYSNQYRPYTICLRAGDITIK